VCPLLPITSDSLLCISGWCWANEWQNSPFAIYTPPNTDETSSLRLSSGPQCTHAYAVSAPGTRKLLAHLEYPPFTYSRAIDQAYAWLIANRWITAFSFVPQLAIQRKMDRSDISVWEPYWEEGLYHPVLG
jgi:hypothetical protein